MSNPMDVARVADVPRGDTLAATEQAGSSAPTAAPEQTGSQPSKQAQVGLVDMLALWGKMMLYCLFGAFGGDFPDL